MSPVAAWLVCLVLCLILLAILFNEKARIVVGLGVFALLVIATMRMLSQVLR